MQRMLQSRENNIIPRESDKSAFVRVPFFDLLDGRLII
jgi:hypothetical protein